MIRGDPYASPSSVSSGSRGDAVDDFLLHLRVIPGSETKSKYDFDQLEMPGLEHVPADPDGKFTCVWDRCYERRDSRSFLKRHLRNHIRPVLCPRRDQGCNERRGQAKEMKRHFNSHLGILQERFSCDHCSKDCSRRDNLKRHCELYHPESVQDSSS
jgi:hypothetical protein